MYNHIIPPQQWPAAPSPTCLTMAAWPRCTSQKMIRPLIGESPDIGSSRSEDMSLGFTSAILHNTLFICGRLDNPPQSIYLMKLLYSAVVCYMTPTQSAKFSSLSTTSIIQINQLRSRIIETWLFFVSVIRLKLKYAYFVWRDALL